MVAYRKGTQGKVAVIPGDGIGKEVMPEGMRTLEAAGANAQHRFRVDGI